MVVLVDSDAYRENPTSPGGCRSTARSRPSRPGVRPSSSTTTRSRRTSTRCLHIPVPSTPTPTDDVVSAIGARIEAAKPRAVVWWFSQPNAWERRLADVLVRAGSSRTTPAARPVWGADRSRWRRADPGRDAVGASTTRRSVRCAAGRSGDLRRPACGSNGSRRHVRQAAARPRADRHRARRAAAWASGASTGGDLGETSAPSCEPQGLEYLSGTMAAGARSRRLRGEPRAVDRDGEERRGSPVPGPRPLGRDCLALQDGGGGSSIRSRERCMSRRNAGAASPPASSA